MMERKREQQTRARRWAHGFTYVELMMVLTIIAILSAIAVPNFLEARTRALVSASRASQTVLNSAVESYRLEQRAYPPNRTAREPNGWDLAVLTTPVDYLTMLPFDPFTVEKNIGREASADLKRNQPFHYLNGLQLDPHGGLKVGLMREEKESPTSTTAIAVGYRGMLIWGQGPALERWGSSESLFAPATLMIVQYDPTNGTTSPGGLHPRFFVAGGAPAGDRGPSSRGFGF